MGPTTGGCILAALAMQFVLDGLFEFAAGWAPRDAQAGVGVANATAPVEWAANHTGID